MKRCGVKMLKCLLLNGQAGLFFVIDTNKKNSLRLKLSYQYLFKTSDEAWIMVINNLFFHHYQLFRSVNLHLPVFPHFFYLIKGIILTSQFSSFAN